MKPPAIRRLRAVGIGALAGVLLAGLIPASPALAQTAPRRIMSGWMPYWTTQESMQSFIPNADLFSDVSPFWHNAARSSSTASGVVLENNWLSYSNRATLLNQMRGRGVAILPSITDGTGALYMRGVLRSAGRRNALVNQIVNLVTSNGYDGIDLDFEKFAFSDGSSTWSTTAPAWVTFVSQLGAALHARGKKLAVTVPPMGTSASNYWVYSWRQIAPHIDKLRIMAYDYSWDTPGPVGGPLSWVAAASAYARSVVPAHKIQMGAPTYGRDWVKSMTGSGCPSLSSKKTLTTRDIGRVYGIPASSWGRHGPSGERVLNYTVRYNAGKCIVSRVAYVPDTQTVLMRARQASQYGINGIATWMVGSETANQWAPLRNIARTMPFATSQPLAQSIAITRAPTSVARGSRFVIAGKLTPGRSVAVRFQRFVKGSWRAQGAAVRTNAQGEFSKAFTTRTLARIRVIQPGNAAWQGAVSRVVVVRIS